MLKQEIRKSMKELKSRLTEPDRRAYSDRILKRLWETSAYGTCRRIFCYVSFNQEVITTGLIEKALYQQKKVAVPKITDDEMKFYYIDSLKELKPGVLGILEPAAGKVAVPVRTEENLIIVPGLAFDPQGNRIGYGKGYYDVFFQKYENYPLKKIALAYDFQVLTELPADELDIKVDQIITPSGIIR